MLAEPAASQARPGRGKVAWRVHRPGELWLVVALVGTLGCSKVDVHPFYAAAYDSSTGCLGDVVVVDVLNGEDPGRCNQSVCWLNPSNGTAYVSIVMCDGPSDFRRVNGPGSGTACDDALAAYARSGFKSCPEDGGAADAGSE